MEEDETKQGDKSGEVATDDNKTDGQDEPTVKVEDLKKQTEELTALAEKQKTEIAGLNKANSLKKNEYDELLKKHETDHERIEREQKERLNSFENEKNALINDRATLLKEKNDFLVQLKASELRLDLTAIKELGFSTVEQVEAYAKQLDVIKQTTTEQATENIKKDLSGVNRDSYTKDKGENAMPSALEKAFA